jgi:glycosyltransferase involved in cell wall biosynthesis
MNVSIVVCAYTEKRWDDLATCIQSLQTQDEKPFEIILVIDHNPVLLTRAKEYFSEVTVLENPYQRGLSGSRNGAIEQARGDILAFIDDDAVASHDWLSHMMCGYDDPSILGVGGRILPQWEQGRPNWFPEEFDWVVGCTYRGMPEAKASVRNLIGCNMSFRREVFSILNGFSVDMGRIGTLPLGCEETELCIRARQHWPNRILIYESTAMVTHRVPKSRATMGYFYSRCYSEGKSKAMLSRLVGTNDGLSSERAYTFRTLPSGFLRGIWKFLMRLEVAGLRQAFAIVSGLLVTTIGYAAMKIGIADLFRPPLDPSDRHPAT